MKLFKIKSLDLPADNHCEGLIWIAESNELAWVDVFNNPKIRILNFDNDECKTIYLPGPVSSIAPQYSGDFVATMDGGFYLVSYFRDPIHKASPLKFHRNELLNDGRCDSRGRYVCASMDIKMRNEIGKLYQLGENGEIRVLDENFIVGNGISFSPAEDILYVSDSRKDVIWKYDYDIIDGKISNKKLFFSTSELDGRPDGAAIDYLGNYWCCLFEGGSIVCIDHHTGLISFQLQLPVMYPTMCTFGGKELDRLYVTTSKMLLSVSDVRKQPMAGKILEISNIGVSGCHSVMYSS